MNFEKKSAFYSVSHLIAMTFLAFTQNATAIAGEVPVTLIEDGPKNTLYIEPEALNTSDGFEEKNHEAKLAINAHIANTQANELNSGHHRTTLHLSDKDVGVYSVEGCPDTIKKYYDELLKEVPSELIRIYQNDNQHPIFMWIWTSDTQTLTIGSVYNWGFTPNALGVIDLYYDESKDQYGTKYERTNSGFSGYCDEMGKPTTLSSVLANAGRDSLLGGSMLYLMWSGLRSLRRGGFKKQKKTSLPQVT